VSAIKKELPVLITVDVCDGAFDTADRKARFKHVMDSLPEIKDTLNEVINAGRGGMLPVTWFVRSDSQVAENTGDAAGLVRGWSTFWDEIRDLGGEIGWHPHLYKRDDQGWKPIREPKRLTAEAEKIWHEITSLGWRPTASRIGESVGANELMVFLDSVGIKCDSTALPGRVRDDGTRFFDWQRTPQMPYHPAKGDYRRPAESRGASDKKDGEEPLGILEIPFSTASIRAPYDPHDPSTRPPKRYIDLSYDPEPLRRGLGRQFSTLQYLSLVIHPMQAIGRGVPDGGLVVGGKDVLRTNLRTIMESIEQLGRTPYLLTMSAFRSLWLDVEMAGIGESAPVVIKEKKITKKSPATKAKRVRIAKVEGDKQMHPRPASRGKSKEGPRPPKAGPRTQPG
jgi:hypothetical protein